MIAEPKVRLPGFTAEFSLNGRRHYVALERPSGFGVEGKVSTTVVPQLRIWQPGDCIPGCVCVRPEGCPCCGYEMPWPFGGLFRASGLR